MNALLRSRHWGMSLGLMLLVPPIALVALTSRPTVSTVEPLLPSLSPGGSTLPGIGTVDTGSATLKFPSLPVQARLFEDRVSEDRGDPWLILEAMSPLVVPDPLVYWTTGDQSAQDGEGLPANATLLGAWDGRSGAFRLPTAAGSVWLYSLGHQRVLGVLSVPGADLLRGDS